MKAAVVQARGRTPVFTDFEDPTPADGEALVTVAAAALSQLTRGRASGAHYSSAGTYPFVAGVDGVGRDPAGRRVYFMLPRSPFGGMAECTVVPESQCVPVPDDLDDVMAAALANPGMSSWVALTQRARISQGAHVLINGATGTSGQLAVRIARHLGAAKVIATGRNPTILRKLAETCADRTISLAAEDADVLDERLEAQFAEGVDIVLDYLYGSSAERILRAASKAGREGVPMRFVQIGSMSGGAIEVPAAVLRSSGIEMMGSGLGSVGRDRLAACIGDLLKAAGPAGLTVATRALPLADVSQAWADQGDERRVVLVTD